MKKFLFCLILIFPFMVKGKCSIVMSDNGQVLYGDDVHHVQSVASISKVMTSIISLENSNLNKKIRVGNEISKAYGSGIYIKKGEELRIIDLLYGLLLRSGNDAALELSKDIGYDRFVFLMNEKAKKLGMLDSKFNNPSGLDEENGNYSSCYDMANLMRYALKNKSFRKIIHTKYYSLKTNKNTYKWKNKNRLLFDYRYMIGGKTGFTKKAGRTLVTSSRKKGYSLIVVTMRDPNDFLNHKRLYERYFNNYEKYSILKKGKIRLLDKTYYVKNSFDYLLTNEEKDLVNIKFKLSNSINKAEIYIGDKKVGERKIYKLS